MLAKASFVTVVAIVTAYGLVACVSDAPASNDADSGAANDASTGDTGSSDGGNADSSADAGPSCDAALPALTTGVVQCVTDAGCSNEQCCYATSGTTDRCYTQATQCSTDSFQCDKPSDCGGNTNICCLAGTLGQPACPFVVPSATGSVCRSTLDGGCAATEIELCSLSETCSGGKKCRALVANVSANSTTYTRKLGGCF